jgi:RHH-type rel operon transcriptional repressor/antitoxin RelB
VVSLVLAGGCVALWYAYYERVPILLAGDFPVPTAIRLNPRLEERLERLAKRTGRSNSLYLRRALEQFLDQQEDYLIALQRLDENLPPIPWEAALNGLNLRNQLRSKASR